jgi:hypothetical protein
MTDVIQHEPQAPTWPQLVGKVQQRFDQIASRHKLVTWAEKYSAHKLGRMQTIGGDIASEYKDPRVEYAFQAWQASLQHSKPAADIRMNPRLWTREMSDAWHSNIPDLQKAFEALAAASPEQKEIEQ